MAQRRNACPEFNSEALGMQPTHSFLACVRSWVPSPVGKERKGRRKNRYRQTDREKKGTDRDRNTRRLDFGGTCLYSWHLRSMRKENVKFEAILGYMGNCRRVWAS